MQDQVLQCRDCGKNFTWTVGEQEFYKQKGFDNAPVRCPDCRSKKKMSNNGGSFGNKSFPITCSNCGKQDTVPFEPKGDKPVLCRDCFKAQKGGDNRRGR
jgi:CxxC-x17-CxxC domain-containing protein